MNKSRPHPIHRFCLVVTLLAASIHAGAPPQKQTEPKGADLVKEVRHQLVMLPYYSVFDNLSYKVEGSKVTLIGQVVRPTLKSDSEAVVKKLEGVTSVQNDIEVLPVSPMDDRLRRALYRAIYSAPGLSRYSYSAVPSIHIIVKDGNVTLEGVVDNEADKNLAGIRGQRRAQRLLGDEQSERRRLRISNRWSESANRLGRRSTHRPRLSLAQFKTHRGSIPGIRGA